MTKKSLERIRLGDLLMREQSRSNTDMVVNIILKRPELFSDLWSLMLGNNGVISRRAAWAADLCAEINPGFLIGRLEVLIDLLPLFNSDGLKRHGLRMLTRETLPEPKFGILADTCFKWLEDPSESIAVKVYSMEILKKIALALPEISRELHDIIEIQMGEASPGFRSMGRKVLKQLK